MQARQEDLATELRIYFMLDCELLLSTSTRDVIIEHQTAVASSTSL